MRFIVWVPEWAQKAAAAYSDLLKFSRKRVAILGLRSLCAATLWLRAEGFKMMIRLPYLRKLLGAALFCVSCLPCAAEPIAFRQALELALQHSGTLYVAKAEQEKARDLYQQARAPYYPTVILGSGLGYTNGVPLTIEGNAPSLFNVNSQQSILNLAQRDFLRAAKNDFESSSIDISDKRNSVVLDAATCYMELDNAAVKLKLLAEETQTANHAVYTTTQRLHEGLDSELDLKKAQLNVARMNLRMAETQAAADVAREHLARLIAVPASSIETITDTIPTAPEVRQDQDLAAQAAANSLVVQFARQKIVTAELRARAEAHTLYPSIDLASQYARFSNTFNNYSQFYKSFQPNNFTVGLLIRVPVIDYAQRARASAATADLLRARKAAELAQNQVEEATLKIQRTVRQLAAANEVARLQYEVAQAAIDAVRAKLAAGEANQREEENARIEAGDLYAAYLDSQLQLSRTTLQLLRQTGELDGWALAGK